MKKKHSKTKRYIVIEFDGTTTKACTFRGIKAEVLAGGIKDFRSAEAKLHPDDKYDQNTGIRIALERLGFDVSDNPFAAIFKTFEAMSNAVREIK